tara:strand:+ start:8335 stop:8703 length:369 start_codon:yes stop_codon:yes gene_type:complete
MKKDVTDCINLFLAHNSNCFHFRDQSLTIKFPEVETWFKFKYDPNSCEMLQYEDYLGNYWDNTLDVEFEYENIMFKTFNDITEYRFKYDEYGAPAPYHLLSYPTGELMRTKQTDRIYRNYIL